MKIGFTADSSSGLAYAPFDSDVKITKTAIHFGNETLVDGVDITADQFYLRLENEKAIPTTTAPTTGEIIARIEELKALGVTDVIHFPISTNLSAYGKNLKTIIDPLIEGINFHVCDTKSATLMQGYLVHFAEKLRDLGYDVEKIMEEVLVLRTKMNAYFIVDDLKYLIKNGRLSSLTGTIGILAKIKPILHLNQEGRIVTSEKIRIHSKAIKRIFEKVKSETEYAKKVTYLVLHTNRLEDANKLALKIENELLNVKRVLVTTITPTVGAHIGSKVLGLGYSVEDDYYFF